MPPTITQNRRPPAKPTPVAPLSELEELIQPMGFDDGEGIKVLNYGPSGSGKTRLWGSYPGEILAILRSGGRRPGELRSINTPENRKRIKQAVIAKSSQFRGIVQMLESGNSPFTTVVLDHISGLQDLILAEILGIDGIPEQKHWGLASQQQYGQCTAQCKEILRALLNLPINVHLVAQERAFNEEGDGTSLLMPYVGPAVTPSLAGWITPAVDYIVHSYKRQKTETVERKIGTNVKKVQVPVEGVDYCLRVGPDATYMTKFRVPPGTPLPHSLVDATYEDIKALIDGSAQ
jgi:hypothetical protein